MLQRLLGSGCRCRFCLIGYATKGLAVQFSFLRRALWLVGMLERLRERLQRLLQKQVAITRGHDFVRLTEGVLWWLYKGSVRARPGFQMGFRDWVLGLRLLGIRV